MHSCILLQRDIACVVMFVNPRYVYMKKIITVSVIERMRKMRKGRRKLQPPTQYGSPLALEEHAELNGRNEMFLSR